MHMRQNKMHDIRRKVWLRTLIKQGFSINATK